MVHAGLVPTAPSDSTPSSVKFEASVPPGLAQVVLDRVRREYGQVAAEEVECSMQPDSLSPLACAALAKQTGAVVLLLERGVADRGWRCELTVRFTVVARVLGDLATEDAIRPFAGSQLADCAAAASEAPELFRAAAAAQADATGADLAAAESGAVSRKSAGKNKNKKNKKAANEKPY